MLKCGLLMCVDGVMEVFLSVVSKTRRMGERDGTARLTTMD